MSWFETLIEREILREIRELKHQCHELRKEVFAIGKAVDGNTTAIQQLTALQSVTLKKVKDIATEVSEIHDILRPRLSQIVILSRGADPMDFTVEVGAVKTSYVQGFDQSGQPFAIDFGANPPAWSIVDSSVATATPNPTTPTDEDVTGVTAGAATTLNVTCAGFPASALVTVVAATPKLSSIQILQR